MKTIIPTGLIVYVCLEIVLGVEPEAEPAANGSVEFAEAAPSVAGAPKGYWSLRSWVRSYNSQNANCPS